MRRDVRRERICFGKTTLAVLGRATSQTQLKYCRDGYTRKDAERNIFANPFKRFENMRFMKRCREIELVEFNRYVFKKLTREYIEWIKEYCDRKLEEYYGRIER